MQQYRTCQPPFPQRPTFRDTAFLKEAINRKLVCSSWLSLTHFCLRAASVSVRPLLGLVDAELGRRHSFPSVLQFEEMTSTEGQGVRVPRITSKTGHSGSSLPGLTLKWSRMQSCIPQVVLALVAIILCHWGS